MGQNKGPPRPTKAFPPFSEAPSLQIMSMKMGASPSDSPIKKNALMLGGPSQQVPVGPDSERGFQEPGDPSLQSLWLLKPVPLLWETQRHGKPAPRRPYPVSGCLAGAAPSRTLQGGASVGLHCDKWPAKRMGSPRAVPTRRKALRNNDHSRRDLLGL